MADEATTKAVPTVAELETKVARLATQVEGDQKAANTANDAFTKAVKSGNVDEALRLADERTSTRATLGKSEGQLKTARGAIVSAKRAANAGKIADQHNAMRSGLENDFAKLEALGVEWLKVERSKETGKLILNSGGAEVKRSRGSGGGTGGRGTPVTVDGQEYASASAAHVAFFPGAGPLNRQSIIDKLVNAGHEVA